MTDVLHAFYCSKAWRELSYNLKVTRGGRCERCDFVAVTTDEWARLIGHHTTELTEQNVLEPMIALNPDNVEIICQDCHNKQHRRFGHQGKKRVFVVWGSPLSGKTSAVRDMMQYGDILFDIDALWTAVTMQSEYSKPDNVRYNIFALRDALLDQIKTRYGNWYDAYIVGGYPDKYERERLAQTMGAEMIYCESTLQECLDRRRDSARPAVWDEYIMRWWETYERTGR